MKLHDPQISILVDEDGARVEVTDSLSGTTFLRARMTAENFTAALGRLVNVACEADVYGLDHVGLKLEHKPFTFKLPDGRSTDYNLRAAAAYEVAKQVCPDGWEPTNYFGSQNSFFTKDGEAWARCNIERWVPVEDKHDQ